MNARSTDNDVIARMRAANPVSAAELREGIGENELRRAMDAAIASGPSRSSRSRARRRPVAALAGFSSAALVALVVLLTGTPSGGGGPAFAAAAIEVAEANPRLLVTEPGWSIVSASGFEPDEGGVTFGDGEHTLSITWSPARLYDYYLRDRADVSAPETSRLLGRTATTVDYGNHDYATMLSPMGSVFLEIRAGIGGLGSRAEYDALLRSLRRVDVDTWLGAMPPSVVSPQDRAATVERLLDGVPLPPGFDVWALQTQDFVSSRDQLAAEVGNAVGCGWIESWLAATRAGDAARAREAVDAMAGWRQWPLMKVLGPGNYPTNIPFIVEELESGHLNQGAAMQVINEDGTGYRLGPAWATALDCRSHLWRRPLDPR